MSRSLVQIPKRPLGNAPPTGEDLSKLEDAINKALSEVYRLNPVLGGVPVAGVEFPGVLGIVGALSSETLTLARAQDALCFMRLPQGNGTLTAKIQGDLICAPGNGPNAARVANPGIGLRAVDPRAGTLTATAAWSAWFTGIAAGDALLSTGSDARARGLVLVNHNLGAPPRGWWVTGASLGFPVLREAAPPDSDKPLDPSATYRRQAIWMESQNACLCSLYFF